LERPSFCLVCSVQSRLEAFPDVLITTSVCQELLLILIRVYFGSEMEKSESEKVK